jgi:flavin reductase (DIM6/NTAB) family NADH-FMN oxidoreductase RutF
MNQPAFVEPVPLDRCYRLLNHGPTVLVSAAHQGRANVMAAAWNMALDFSPPKVCVVIDKSTYTRTLIEAEGSFALNVPSAAIADATFTAGSVSGLRDGVHTDKFSALGLSIFAAEKIAAPLVAECVAWLECVRIAEPHIEKNYDLFIAEVVAARADTRVYANGRWTFNNPDHRTLHHVAGGAFLTPGDLMQGNLLGIPPG